MRCLPALLAAFLLALPSAAQQVWIVDDTAATGPDFTNLQNAIGAVADGDVLLVRAGTYPRMIVNGKSLTIAAYPGETPVIDASATDADEIRVSSLAAGKSVRLKGLELRDTFDDAALKLVNCAGTIWIEGCRVVGGERNTGVSVQSCASVALLGVTAVGGAGQACVPYSFGRPGSALAVGSGSSVHAYGSEFRGGRGGEFDLCFTCGGGRIGATGVVSAGTLLLSGSRVVGGASECWVDFCDGPTYPQPGGIGLDVIGGSAHVVDSSVEGGPGSMGGFGEPPCPGPAGPSHSGSVVFLPGRVLKATPLPVARDGETVSLHVEGPPHVLVRLGSSDLPATMPYPSLLRGTLLLGTSPAQTVRTLGVTNAAGVLDATLPVGPLPPLAEAQATFYQVYHLDYDRFPIRRIGETLDTFVLGQGTMLLGIDASF